MLLRNNTSFVLLLVVCCLVNGFVARAQQHSYGRSAPSEDAFEPDTSSRRGVSLRTNLLWDGVAEPNIGFEAALGKHVSLGLNAGIKTWPRWLAWDNDNVQNTTHWRNFAIVPEFRWYPREVYDAWFLGVDLVYTHFNVGNITLPLHLYPEIRNNRLQGDFYGGGLFGGYSWWLGKHWRLELEAGVAVGLAHYGQYECSHCGPMLDDVRRLVLVPKLGLNIAWNPVERAKSARKAEKDNNENK